MKILAHLRLLLQITRTHDIARRYFVTNGFDGTLTMLGLTLGFRLSNEVPMEVALSASLGATIALGMSGLSSAYISEAAERKKELRELEEAMLSTLDDSAHARAAQLVPILIALVNSLTPVLLALIIMLPMWATHWGVALPASPLDLAIILAFVLIFLMGVFLGRIGGGFWLWSGLKTLAIAAITSLLILILEI